MTRSTLSDRLSWELSSSILSSSRRPKAVLDIGARIMSLLRSAWASISLIPGRFVALLIYLLVVRAPNFSHAMNCLRRTDLNWLEGLVSDQQQSCLFCFFLEPSSLSFVHKPVRLLASDCVAGDYNSMIVGDDRWFYGDIWWAGGLGYSSFDPKTFTWASWCYRVSSNIVTLFSVLLTRLLFFNCSEFG